jgi:hypothetical protein
VEWIRENVPAGSTMLLEQYWLDLDGVPVSVTRVPDLAVALDKGIDGVAGYDWVIVPEIHFGHPALRRLGFVKRIHAEQGFGGSQGHDYEIYRVPK